MEARNVEWQRRGPTDRETGGFRQVEVGAEGREGDVSVAEAVEEDEEVSGGAGGGGGGGGESVG